MRVRVDDLDLLSFDVDHGYLLWRFGKPIGSKVFCPADYRYIAIPAEKPG
jgi:hypothetical protein